MDSDYSVAELLDFLEHAVDRGLMPTATARALAVASRQVFSVLNDAEQTDVRRLDLDSTIQRFGNKRAKDFNPTSLKEYGRRAAKAVKLFTDWRRDPASFSVKTRTTNSGRRRQASIASGDGGGAPTESSPVKAAPIASGSGYQSSFPVRPGTVVTLTNIPVDLSKAEAERLAQFIRLLALD